MTQHRLAAEAVPIDDETTARFFAFARARHAAALKRASGSRPPWSDDPIIATRRFCNVFRDRDAMTAEFAARWYAPYADHPSQWFAAVIARRGCNVAAAALEYGHPADVGWGPRRWRRIMRARLARGDVSFSSAYRLVTGGATATNMICHTSEVLSAAWRRRAAWRGTAAPRTLSAAVDELVRIRCIGSFMAAQIALDLTLPGCPLRTAPDVRMFAAPGPGSIRGAARLGASRADVVALCVRLAAEANAFDDAWPRRWRRWRASDAEHALCEFDKYERVRETGHGARPLTSARS